MTHLMHFQLLLFFFSGGGGGCGVGGAGGGLNVTLSIGKLVLS